MWAQQWNNIADILTPFPAKPTINVTGEMARKMLYLIIELFNTFV